MSRWGESSNEKWERDPSQDPRYVRAAQEADNRYGGAKRESLQWFRFAVGSMSLNVVLVMGVIYLGALPNHLPFLMEVDKASGQVNPIGELRVIEWSVLEATKRRELEGWIANLRSVSSDPNVFKELQSDVRLRATKGANMQLDAYAKAQGLLDRFGQETRTVKITALTTIPGSENAYRVEWREKIYEPDGEPSGTEDYVGEFHLKIRQPEDLSQMHSNSSGVFVAFFDISKKR